MALEAIKFTESFKWYAELVYLLQTRSLSLFFFGFLLHLDEGENEREREGERERENVGSSLIEPLYYEALDATPWTTNRRHTHVGKKSSSAWYFNDRNLLRS